MELFKKRETLTQNIAYMGIMAAINVVAVVLMNYVLPILFVPFLLVLPFTSTVVTLYCKKRYFIFYAIAVIGICLLVTLNNFSDTLFYIMPSVISGFLFGVALSYRLPSYLAIFFTALANVALTYLSLPIIELLYKQNMILAIAKLFGLESFPYLDFVVPAFILLISIIQETLTFAFMDSELPKLGIKDEEKDIPFVGEVLGLFGSILALICYLVNPSVISTFALFFTAFAMFFAVYEVVNIACKKQFKWLIVDGIITLISFVLFGVFYQYIPKPYGLVTLNIYFDLLILVSLVNYSLTKIRK